jgi:hypothetical protein
MNTPALPAQIGVAEFDQLHDNLPAWRQAMQLLLRYSNLEAQIAMP